MNQINLINANHIKELFHEIVVFTCEEVKKIRDVLIDLLNLIVFFLYSLSFWGSCNHIVFTRAPHFCATRGAQGAPTAPTFLNFNDPYPESIRKHQTKPYRFEINMFKHARGTPGLDKRHLELLGKRPHFESRNVLLGSFPGFPVRPERSVFLSSLVSSPQPAEHNSIQATVKWHLWLLQVTIGEWNEPASHPELNMRQIWLLQKDPEVDCEFFL